MGAAPFLVQEFSQTLLQVISVARRLVELSHTEVTLPVAASQDLCAAGGCV